jgi:hypothetical protein
MAIEILTSHFDDQDFGFFFLGFFILTIWDYILVIVWTQFFLIPPKFTLIHKSEWISIAKNKMKFNIKKS